MKKLLSSLVFSGLLLGMMPATPLANAQATKEYSRVLDDPFDKYSFSSVMLMVNAIKNQSSIIYDAQNKIVSGFPTGHPKIFITPQKRTALNTKIATYFASWMQEMVDEVELQWGQDVLDPGKHSDVPDAQELVITCALIHQLGAIPGVNYAHPIAAYGPEGVRHLMNLVSVDPNFVHEEYIMPLGYDWLYDLLTPAQRQIVADEMMDMADLSNLQISAFNNPPGAELLGPLALYGDWDYVSEAEVKSSLDLFHNGRVAGDIALLPKEHRSTWMNIVGYQIFSPQGMGIEAVSYSGWHNPFYPILLAWRDQTGEDYFKLPWMHKWAEHYTHTTGNEYEHQDKYTMLEDRVWIQGLREFLNVMAQLEIGLLPTDPDTSALLKYHRKTSGIDRFVSRANKVLYMLLADGALVEKSPTQLGMDTSAHFEGTNNIFARNSWSGTDSTWIQFTGPTWNNVRNLGPLNDLNIWKNGGMLLAKHEQGHDYDGGNRTNTMLLYSQDHPGKTFTPRNVMDNSGNRYLGIAFNQGPGYTDLTRNLLGYGEGLEYYEEEQGEYLYAFGDGAQRFDMLMDNGDCCVPTYINLDKWTRQLVWFRQPNNADTEYFMVFDRIDAPQGTQPHLRWNFNMNPEIQDRVTRADKGAGQQLFPGVYKYGDADRMKITNTVTSDWGTANARLFMDTLLPKDVDYYRMGGVVERNVDLFGNLRPDNLETSGDPNDPKNIAIGMWRVQIADQSGGNQSNFLHVLQATDTGVAHGVDTVLLEGAGIIGAAVDDKMAIFSAAESTINIGSVTIPAGAVGTYDVLISDLEPNTLYDIEFGSVTHNDVASSNQGVLYFKDVVFSNPTSAAPDSLWKKVARFLGLESVLAAESNQIRVTKGNSVPDFTPPTISNVQAVNVASTSATITWTTDEPATKRVDYGITTQYGSTVSSSVLSTIHSMELTGLAPETLHHFKVSSSDASGNLAESTGHTFTTTDNNFPVVDAGPNQTITSATANLTNATVTDDGLPNPPGAVTITWSKVSGPGSVIFGDPNALSTTAQFSAAGPYILELAAFDGGVTSTDTVTITFNTGGGGSQICGDAGTVNLSDQLVGHWTFDEGTGTTAADSSGSGNNGTLVNAPEWVSAGRIGGAIKFAGNDDHVSVPTESTNPISSPTNKTVTMWMKVGQLQGSTPIFSKGENRYSAGTAFTAGFNAGSYEGMPRFTMFDTANQSSVVASTNLLTLNTWQHVAFLFDGQNTRICVNGRLDKEATQNITAIRQNGGEFSIGGTFAGSAPGYIGELDDVRIYNRALNATEIDALANPVQELCIQGQLENRVMDGESRMDLPNVSVTVTDTVTSTVVKDVVVPMDVSGKISLTDLTGVSDSATYDIAVRPHGLLSKTLSNQTNVISGGCIDAGTFLLIDANGDGLLGLADLVGFVNYYRTLVHGTLEGVFAYLRPGVNHLVRAVANFIAQQ